MRRLAWFGCLVLCGVAGLASILGAQRPRDAWCLSPHPLSECGNFVFFDAELVAGLLRAPHTLAPQASTTGGIRFTGMLEEDLGHYGSGIVGFMSNRDSVHSLGASFEFGYAGAQHPRVSAKLHRRTWFANRSSLDVSAGPLAAEVLRVDDGPQSRCLDCLERAWSYGVTSDVAVTERHGFGLVGGADLITGNGRTSFGLHAGARTESATAVLATALAALLGAAAYALVAGAGGF